MSDPDAIRLRIAEAQTVLASLGMPLDQQKSVPALTFLALNNLGPNATWASASNPLMGVSPIMEFVNANHSVNYKENSRETFRKQAVHYFEEARLIVKNPDEPNRKTNSPNTVYQLNEAALMLVRDFGTPAFAEQLTNYLNAYGSLTDKFAVRRTLDQVELRLLTGQQVSMSPGTHSGLIEAIINDFGSRFTPNGILLYAGDTEKKWQSYFDAVSLSQIGVFLEPGGSKMPDVVIYHEDKNWLVIVEAFDSVGPIDPLRRS